MAQIFNKPFLKWLGGKSEAREEIVQRFPKRFGSFHDVFLGSGSVLIHVLHMVREAKLLCEGPICAYDSNMALIATFENVKIACEELIAKCKELQDAYNDSSDQSGFYYSLRTRYNSIPDKGALDASALFIFLNKTCFRGMYRESRRSGFNVPFGNYIKVNLLNPPHMHHLSRMFQNVQFCSQSYEITLRSVRPGALVYLDPPYVPMKASSFVTYTNNGFCSKQHAAFFKTVAELHKYGVFFVMSNSSNEIVREAFRGFTIRQLVGKRKITPKRPNANCQELLVTNEEKHTEGAESAEEHDHPEERSIICLMAGTTA